MGNPFKSVKDVPPTNFLEQFGKDLANPDVSDLSQLKWVFDGKKVPADFKSKMMEEIKKIDVDSDVCKKLGAKDKDKLITDINNSFDNIFIIGK